MDDISESFDESTSQQGLNDCNHSIRCTKCKIAPISERYMHNEWVRIQTNNEDDKYNSIQRVTIITPDGERNDNYRVTGVSDSLLTFTTSIHTTHEKLEQSLRNMGIWDDTFEAIEVPRNDARGGKVWAAGFKTQTYHIEKYDQYRSIVKQAKPVDEVFFSSENDFETFL